MSKSERPRTSRPSGKTRAEERAERKANFRKTKSARERKKKVKAQKEADANGTGIHGKAKCSDTTMAGNPCRSWASYPDGKCRAHTDHVTAEERTEQAIKGNDLKKARRPKPHELMQKVLEARPELFMRPFLDALGITVTLDSDPETGEIIPVVAETGDGAVLYGVSKDGDVVISKHKDLEGQMRAAERLMDRVYGKPRQTNIIVNPAQENYTPEVIPYNAERQTEIAQVLAEAGAGVTAPAVVPSSQAGPAAANGNGNGNGNHGRNN